MPDVYFKGYISPVTSITPGYLGCALMDRVWNHSIMAISALHKRKLSSEEVIAQSHMARDWTDGDPEPQCLELSHPIAFLPGAAI